MNFCSDFGANYGAGWVFSSGTAPEVQSDDVFSSNASLTSSAYDPESTTPRMEVSHFLLLVHNYNSFSPTASPVNASSSFISCINEV